MSLNASSSEMIDIVALWTGLMNALVSSS